MTQDALKLALEALDNLLYWDNGKPEYDEAREAITAIKEALREHALREVQRLGQEIEQEPVAYLVLFEGAGKLLEFKKGNYIHGAKVEHIPLYAKPQIEVGCAECGVNGGHALYCVACAEKFVGGYKDSGVPAVETGLEQVSPDTQPQRTEPVAYWKEHAQGLQRDYDSLLADFQAQSGQKLIGTVGDLFDDKVIAHRKLDRDLLVYIKENT